MKKSLSIITLLALLTVTILYRVEIQTFIMHNLIFPMQHSSLINNEYTLTYNSHYENIEVYKATNKEELLNSMFSILNSGETEGTFLCDYTECEEDLTNHIERTSSYSFNNYVHPYNTYQEINISLDSLGKVTVSILPNYEPNLIYEIEQEMDNLISELITETMTDREKIKVFHDYIIDNTTYDIDFLNSGAIDITNPSNKATGPLFYGKALCGGYTDAMSIFLNKMNIENYKLSTDNHIWNYVFLDETWYHLDLTWDDPRNNLNEDILLHEFFLITDTELKDKKTGNHDYIIPELELEA